jgi:hypothetical protein
MQIAAARGGVSVEEMACMPPKFRATGVAFSPKETNKDYTAWTGGWTIGYNLLQGTRR